MSKRFVLSLALALAFTLASVMPVHADGIIIPPQPPPPCDPGRPICPPPPVRPISQLQIKYHHVSVTIHQQVATTHVDQVFYNPNDWPIEGTYIFPLPVEAVISEFTLWVDGKPVQGEVLEAEKARRAYQEIVNSLRDPALLEYVGRGALRASIFPIPPGGERRIELEYSQALTAEEGLVRYSYPLNTEKFSFKPLESVSVTVSVQSAEPVRAIYSPSHPVDVIREGENAFKASYEASNVLPDKDFSLYYSIGEAEALHLLSYRDPGDVSEDGYFLLLLAPRPEIDQAAVEKDILLVLDRSGSMEGEKFSQARTALTYILEHLSQGDRFYLSAFSSGIQRYADGLRSAEEAAQAIDWVSSLNAQGSTDINRALLEAVEAADENRLTFLIFLTDGLPSEGVLDSQQILDNFSRSAPDNLRLFSFGVGYDVDTFLLDSLAQEHHGQSTYVKPGEPLDEIVSAFYARVSTPVLTDLELDFGAVSAYDIYPSPLSDLFAGSQIMVVGRYHGGGETDITLTGMVNNRRQRFEFTDNNFIEDSRGSIDELSNLPRLWATRKVGYLLNQIRLRGPDQETIDQIVRLSIRYGIVTPYTSYLVTEPMPLGVENQRELSQDAFQQALAAPSQVFGAGAVNKAAEQGELERAEIPAALPASTEQQVRAVGARTFVLRDGVWTDTAFDPETQNPLRVAFLSEDYFALADMRADLAAALALGEQVIVIADGKAYQVVPEGESVPPLNLPTSPAALSSPTLIPPVIHTPTPKIGLPGATDAPEDDETPTLPGFCLGSYLPLMGLLAWILLSRRK